MGLKSIRQESKPGKACRVCAERIELAAHKCIHCSSWQDWRGKVGSIGNSAISLLIALISVTIAAIPVMERFLTPDKSILSATLQQSSDKYVSAFASNSGGRPGTIREANLIVKLVDKTVDMTLSVVSPDQSGAAVIQANSSILFRLRPTFVVIKNAKNELQFGGDLPSEDETVFAELNRIGTLANSHMLREGTWCQIKYQYTNFDGSRSETLDNVQCVSVAAILFGMSMASRDRWLKSQQLK